MALDSRRNRPGVGELALRGVHRAGPKHRRATWLELFFDLVVVAAVGNLAVVLHDHHDLAGALHFAGLLAVVWWVWISYTYFADLFDEDTAVDRLAQLAAMFGTAVLAVAVADGVGDDSRLFAVACWALFTLLAVLYATTARADPTATELRHWYVVGSTVGALLWAASLLTGPPLRWWVWGAAVVANAAISGPIAYARMRSVPEQASHMPERFGLFTIVVLGEAVLGVVRGVSTTDWAGDAVAVAAGGFVVAAGIWWVYFDGFDERAIDQAIAGGRGTQVRSFLYGYGHLLIYAAVAAGGVGVELAIDAAAHGEATPALLGWSSTAVVAGFVVISSGIGLRGRRPVLAMKTVVALTGAVVALAGPPAVAGTAALAAAWAALVLVEGRAASSPLPLPDDGLHAAG